MLDDFCCLLGFKGKEPRTAYSGVGIVFSACAVASQGKT